MSSRTHAGAKTEHLNADRHKGWLAREALIALRLAGQECRLLKASLWGLRCRLRATLEFRVFMKGFAQRELSHTATSVFVK